MSEKSIWAAQESADIKGIVKSGAPPELVTVGGRIKKLYQQNSPVNNEIVRNYHMNNLYPADIDGQLKFMITEVIAKEKTRNKEPVCTLCSFTYEDDVDLEILNKNGRYKITAYDRRVYNAVCTLLMNKRDIFSYTEIYSVMTGYAKKNPNSRQLEAIEKSLNKLRSIRVYIDLTAELNAHLIVDKKPLIEAGILRDNSDNIKSAVIEDNMLHFRVGTLTSEKGNVRKSIQILCEPSLLTYNRSKNTIISIPMEYIGIEAASATEKVIAFQDYLLMRIMSYRAGKMISNKILYDTIYRDSGVDKPEHSVELVRDRECIDKLMTEWQEKGLINSYTKVKNGRQYEGLVFEADTVGKRIGTGAK